MINVMHSNQEEAIDNPFVGPTVEAMTIDRLCVGDSRRDCAGCC